MSPIPVGIIGLSSSGASWAVFGHLPYLKDSTKYKIVALVNSSKEAAQTAIKVLQLDPTTKAYGTPEELAADPEVKLVLDAVRLDLHYATIKPAAASGKDLFVEWPLASTTAEAKEIVELAKQKGGKVVVGLQGLHAPVIRKLKEILQSGRIGKVLSVDVMAHGFLSAGPGRLPAHFAWVAQEKSGRPFANIVAGHALGNITYVHGDLTPIQSNLRLIYPTIELVDADGEVVGVQKADTPDLVQVYGTLANGGQLTFSLRSDPPLKGTPALDWRIMGRDGSIRFTSSSTAFQALPSEITVQVHDFKTGKVEDVAIGSGNEKLPPTARNTGAVYEAWADGRTDDYVNGQEAVKLQELLDQISAGFKAS